MITIYYRIEPFNFSFESFSLSISRKYEMENAIYSEMNMLNTKIPHRFIRYECIIIVYT